MYERFRIDGGQISPMSPADVRLIQLTATGF